MSLGWEDHVGPKHPWSPQHPCIYCGANNNTNHFLTCPNAFLYDDQGNSIPAVKKTSLVDPAMYSHYVRHILMGAEETPADDRALCGYEGGEIIPSGKAEADMLPLCPTCRRLYDMLQPESN